MKRSDRHGWMLVQITADVLRIVATGDREVLRDQREQLSNAIGRKPGLRHPGEGVALYDANGALRDCYPSFPRLADDTTRVRWPAQVPADGAALEVRSNPPRVTGGAA